MGAAVATYPHLRTLRVRGLGQLPVALSPNSHLNICMRVLALAFLRSLSLSLSLAKFMQMISRTY